jgi:hypothetical protein
MNKLTIGILFVLLFGSIILVTFALLRKHQTNVFKKRFGDPIILMSSSATSGCYFFNGANGAQLFSTSGSGNMQPWIQLSTNAPNRTKWYYNNAEGSIYTMQDSGGVTGFLAPNAMPRGVRGFTMPVTVWDPTQFYNKQAPLNPLAVGWSIQGLNPNNVTSANVTISWQNAGSQGKWYLQSTPQGPSYSMLSQSPDSGFQATSFVQCLSNCQNQNLPNCLAGNPEKQQDCLNDCASGPGLGCPLGCAIDRTIWDALCHNETMTTPTDCNSTCYCSPPAPLLPICGPQATNGVCPSGQACVNGNCQFVTMDITTLNGGWVCNKCSVGNGVGIISMSNGSGSELAGEFINNFTYSYQGGNVYNIQGLTDIGNQNATLSPDGKTLTVGNVDTWTRP